MNFKIIYEFKKKSIAFKITAVIAAVVILVLMRVLYVLNPNISAEDISFDETHIYLQKNMTYALKPNITPYNTTSKNLIYNCSDNSIIKIDNDMIIPLENGTASVYCYDRKSCIKSNIITVEVVDSIEKLIPKQEEKNEGQEINNSFDDTQYVYYTDNGKRYHTKDCHYLGKNPIKGILHDVQQSNRTPCAKCNP